MRSEQHPPSTSTHASDAVLLASSGEVNIGLLVRYTFRSFTRMLQLLVTPFGLTAAEFRVLRTLATGGALTQLQIAGLAGMDRPYAALLAKQLRAKGLIDALKDSTDARRVSMTLSKRGEHIAATIADQLDGVNAAAVAGISGRDLTKFIDVITRIRANLDRLEAERSIPE